MPANPNRITVYLSPDKRIKWERLRALLQQQQQEALSLSAMLDKLVDSELERRQQARREE